MNDGIPDETEAICKKHGVEYIFTGQRNLGRGSDLHWRVPGFALNIGARRATGNILIISCAEMFHLDPCIKDLMSPIITDCSVVTYPIGYDDDGSFIKSGRVTGLRPLNTKLPFLMALHRNHYMEMGGYDEDFIGSCYDDNDFVDRLQAKGCRFQQVATKCVHIYHSRVTHDKRYQGRHLYNKNLYHTRRGTVIRNQGREWGRVES